MSVCACGGGGGGGGAGRTTRALDPSKTPTKLDPKDRRRCYASDQNTIWIITGGESEFKETQMSSCNTQMLQYLVVAWFEPGSIYIYLSVA